MKCTGHQCIASIDLLVLLSGEVSEATSPIVQREDVDENTITISDSSMSMKDTNNEPQAGHVLYLFLSKLR